MIGVCPTYVGMNRKHLGYSRRHTRMPHVCGDEPFEGLLRSEIKKYAPRMWG